ncbi:MAG: RluA family pseudouridine synthase [Patescibacteria group bacterium]|jgi:23S rRNA pseudouridine1911/1915/1917 synthase
MNNSDSKIYVVSSGAGERLDQYLAKENPDYSRNYFAKLIKEGAILVNNKPTKSSYKLKLGDEIKVSMSEIQSTVEPTAQDISLDIIYEDKDVIVLNKPVGMVVHPAAGNYTGTLVNALLAHSPNIKDALAEPDSEISKFRPGIVHRLDKFTSGIMVVAKNARAMHSISRQIMHRDVKKIYLAICYNWPKNETGRMTNYIGRNPKDRKKMAEVGEMKGKLAVSNYKVISYLQDSAGKRISLVEYDIETGRTHQIRLQSMLAGFPVLGDQVYCSKDSKHFSDTRSIERQMLHAKSLSFTIPGQNKQSNFTAEIPEDFNAVLNAFKQID